MFKFRRIVLSAALVLCAGSVFASNFRAADLVYLPAAGRVQGNAFFKTDLVISNTSSDRVVVDVAYAPAGADNRNVTAAANLVRLPVLLPNEKRDIVDFFQNSLNRATGFGQLIFFACREGGNCNDCEASSSDCRLISVEARIYADKGPAGTAGQLFSGIPWYNYVSRDSSDRGLDKVFIAGIRQTGTGLGTFRSNLGFANASQFSSTTLRVTLFRENGTQIGQNNVSLPPLGQTQQNITGLFPGFSGTGWVLIEQVGVTPTDPTNTNPDIAAGLPGFLAYGSILDNITDDPTTLEVQYLEDLDFGCIYGAKPLRRAAKK